MIEIIVFFIALIFPHNIRAHDSYQISRARGGRPPQRLDRLLKAVTHSVFKRASSFRRARRRSEYVEFLHKQSNEGICLS
jgi:hypothetical protein